MTYNIGIIQGDGTGPEVITEARKVLTAATKLYKIKINEIPLDINGESYLKTGKLISKEEFNIIKNFHDKPLTFKWNKLLNK